MPSTLRTRLGQGAAVFAVLGVLCHWVGTHVAYSTAGGQQDYSGSIGDSLSVGSALAALGNACLAVGVVLIAGIVASMVVEEALDRRLWIDADFDDDDEDSNTDSDAGAN
jgi:hypothetical protein